MNNIFEHFQKSISYQLVEKSRINLANIISASEFDEVKFLNHKKIEVSALFDVNYNVPSNELKCPPSLVRAISHQSNIYIGILDIKMKAKYLKYPKQIVSERIENLYRDASYRYYEAEQSLKYLYGALKYISHFNDSYIVSKNIKKFNSRLKRLAIIRSNWVHPESGIAFNEERIFSFARLRLLYSNSSYDNIMLKQLFFAQKKALRDTIDVLLSEYEIQLEYFYEIFHKEIECKGIMFS